MRAALDKFVAFLHELQRRKVFKVGTMYVVTAWALTLGAAELFPAFGAPEWTVRFFAGAAALGLPIALVLAWAFEVSPSGLVRDPGVAEDARPNTGGVAPSATTALFGVHGVVQASWTDASGPREAVFDRSFNIGRDERCEIRLDDALVSRNHAQVSYFNGNWNVTDLGSRNGTYLDGRRVEKTATLSKTATIRLSEGGPSIKIDVRTSAASTTVMAGRSPEAS